MKPPKSAVEDPQGALFQTELAHLVDPQHPLVRLASEIDWASFDPPSVLLTLIVRWVARRHRPLAGGVALLEVQQ